MAITIDDLLIKIRAKNETKRPIEESKRDVNGFNDNVQKKSKLSAGAFLKIGAAIAVVATAVRGLKRSVDLAMEAYETANLFKEVFKDQTKVMNEWVGSVASKLNLNPSELQRNVALITAMGNSMGLTKDNATTLGKNMTLLANDLSSFYNISTDEAFTKLRSGISGEAEPLKQLGINVTETAIKTSALKHGIAGVSGEMTNQEKVAARYMAILDQTKDAQGDMARTLSSPANMARALGTSLKGLAVSIGNTLMPLIQAILPYLLAFTRVLTDAFNALSALVGFKGVDLGGGAGTAAITEGLSGVSDGAKDAQKSLDGASVKAKALKKELAGFDDINILNEQKDDSTSSSGGSGSSVGAGLGADAFVLPDYDAGLDNIQNKVGDIVNGIKSAIVKIDFKPLMESLSNLWDKVQPILDKIKSALVWIYDNILVPIGKWIIEVALPKFIDKLADAFQIISPVLDIIGKQFLVLYDEILKPLGILLGDVIITLFEFLPIVFQALIPIIGKVIEVLVSLIIFIKDMVVGLISFPETIMNFFNDVWSGILGFFTNMKNIGKDAVFNIIDKVKKPFSDAYNAVKDFISKYYDIGKSIISKLFSGAINGIKSIASKVLAPFTSAYNELKKQLSKWTNIGKSLIDGVIKGIEDNAKKIVDKLLGVLQNAWKAVKNFFGIKSPSQLMRKSIGQMLPLGIAVGIEDRAKKVINTASNLAKNISSSFSDNINLEKPNVDIGIQNGLFIPQYEYAVKGNYEPLNIDKTQFELLQKQQQEWILENNKDKISVENKIAISMDGEELNTKLEKVRMKKQFRKGFAF